ncbi:transposable element Tcb1 transposase [Trichonephila clavipes]|nr:transposable element Tcb1 transposase [Trichonephila clavipes]
MWPYPAGSIRGTWNHPESSSAGFGSSAGFQDDGNVSRCYSTGHPRVTTTIEEPVFAVIAKRNRPSSASDLSRHLSSATGTTVSRQTVYKRVGLSDVFLLPQLTVNYD